MLDAALADWTAREGEGDAGPGPAGGELGAHAVHVQDVTAVGQAQAGRFAERFSEADHAEVLTVLSQRGIAAADEARHAVGLVGHAPARMSAGEGPLAESKVEGPAGQR